MELVYRNYLFVLQREREGISFEATCDGNKKCSSLKDFIEEWNRISTTSKNHLQYR